MGAVGLSSPLPSPLRLRDRALIRLGDLLICPSCLGLRCGPAHLGLRLFFGRH